MQPTEDMARDIAVDVVGQTPTKVFRFTTGTSHYVYEATFGNGPPVVVRIGNSSAHAQMAGQGNLLVQ